MANKEWMNDKSIRDIDSNKLYFLQQLVFESENLNQKEQMPFFLALASRAKQANIQFTENEVERIVNALKKHSTKQEAEKMDQVLKMFHSRMKK